VGAWEGFFVKSAVTVGCWLCGVDDSCAWEHQRVVRTTYAANSKVSNYLVCGETTRIKVIYLKRL
jgi:hypothetical protein